MIVNYYNRFVNFIQQMPTIWFVIIWFVLFAGIMLCIATLFKKYDAEKNKFKKVSMLIVAAILMAILIYLSYIRK